MSEEINAEVETDNESVEVNAEPQQEEKQSDEVKEESEGKSNDEPKDEDFVPFPKKAVNAISRRDKEINKLRAKLRELEAQKEAKASQPARPREEDFETYGDFLRADIKYDLMQEGGQPKVEPKQAEVPVQGSTPEEQAYYAEKNQSIAVKANEYAKTIPDYQATLAQHLDYVDLLPKAIQDVFYEAEDAALAFYNLAKQGTLYELADMTPTQAAMAIAKAQNVSRPKPTTNAPRPIKGINGTGAGSVGLAAAYKDSDPDKLLNYLKSIRNN